MKLFKVTGVLFFVFAIAVALVNEEISAQDRKQESLRNMRDYYSEYFSQPIQLEKFANMFTAKVLAKAAPDEDFYGIGDPRNKYDPSLTSFGGTPKTNQAYVWGLTKSGNNLWFGTAPNVHCLVIGGYLQQTEPHSTDCWVCEFGENKNNPYLPASLGDWRPPRLFAYDLKGKALIEKTQLLTGLHLLRLNTTLGIRSAGSLGNVILLSGPALPAGINIFAFNASTGDFLGSATLKLLPDNSVPTNIRKWIVAGNSLYTGIGTNNGGRVLKWTGNESNPFSFEIVGRLDGEGAELALHEGRIFVSTWPTGNSVAGLWMSPLLTEEGLKASDAELWQKVWSCDEYEPDPVTARTYGGGALASFQGYLYWGTMHVPFMGFLAHINYYHPWEQNDTLPALIGTHRAISIFRGKNFGTPGKEVRLLYGMPYLSVYDPVKLWHQVPNKMGQKPLYGLSGFGNIWNNYTWTMDVYNNQLFVGTMDWSFLAFNAIGELSKTLASILSTNRTEGADLFRFPSAYSPAMAVSLDGAGNQTSYGIRTMLSDDYLYLGMANPMNLSPKGGWELIKLMPLGIGAKDGAVQTNSRPEEFRLLQNYPNPFNPNTTITYSLPAKGQVSFRVVNLLGETLREINETQEAGTYEIGFNAGSLPSGIYIYSLTVNSNDGSNYTDTKKMMLVK